MDTDIDARLVEAERQAIHALVALRGAKAAYHNDKLKTPPPPDYDAVRRHCVNAEDFLAQAGRLVIRAGHNAQYALDFGGDE